MQDRKVVVSSNFNAMDLVAARLEKEWIDYRIKIFMNFTLKSLMNQINQDFLALVIYDVKSEELVRKALGKYNKLPHNVKFVSNKEYSRSLGEYIESCAEFYLVRIDSDDMYHKSYIQQMHDYKPQQHTVVLINQQGYMYDVATNRLAYWSHFSPPYYTFIYNTKEYLNGMRYKLPGGHSKIIRFCHEILPAGNFMVVVHGGNTTSHFDRLQRGAIIEDGSTVESVLKDFKG